MLTQACTQFGFEVLRALQSKCPDENVFISPMSIAVALAMTAKGASGATRDAILQVLHSDQQPIGAFNAIDDVFEAMLKQQDHDGAWLESIDLRIRLAGVAGKEEPPYFTGKKSVAVVSMFRIEWMMSSEKLFGK